jgi:hypothetical protein
MLRAELLAKSGSYWIGFATKATLRPSVRRGYASSNTSKRVTKGNPRGTLAERYLREHRRGSICGLN